MIFDWAATFREQASRVLAGFARRVVKRISGDVVDDTVVFLRQMAPLRLPLTVAGDDPCSIVVIEDGNDPLFRTLCERFPDKHFDLRLQEPGRSCVVVLVEGELAGYGWVAEGACFVEEINCRLILAEEEIYIYDCIIFPAFRRRGLYAALLKAIVDRGLHTCIGCSIQNARSFRVIRSVGFIEYERVRYRRSDRKESWLHVCPVPGSVIPASVERRDGSIRAQYRCDSPPSVQ